MVYVVALALLVIALGVMFGSVLWYCRTDPRATSVKAGMRIGRRISIGLEIRRQAAPVGQGQQARRSTGTMLGRP